MNDGMESYNGHLSCKSHTARTDKDLYRICPSKLSKRELEDLYFALLEQNVQLKKTINDQRDQIKLLNTKVQRMTTQKSVVGFHNRDCCAGTKAIINEQKEAIADLKKANERLSERLRLLNMRLCSAKQFLRRGSSQAASHCSKCLVSSTSNKNSSMSALNTKGSDVKLVISCSPCRTEQDNTKLQMAEIAVPTLLTDIAVPTQLTDIAVPTQLTDIAVPTQMTEMADPTQLVEIVMPTQSTEVTSSRTEIPVRETPCKRDECKFEIDELKMKIFALEEEVCNVRHSHSERMRSLEAAQTQCGLRSARFAADCKDSRQQTDDLATQLQQQQARVSELLATDRTDRTAACPTKDTLPLNEVRVSNSPEPGFSEWENVPRVVVPNNSGISIFIEEKRHKSSDDSGFTVCNNSDLGEKNERTLQERDGLIENQIANIQSKLVYMKANGATEAQTPSIGLGAESDLSHDIFSTARIKTFKEFDKVPSTSPTPDVLVSLDQINDEVSLSEKPQEYVNVFKYNIPTALSLDMPKIIESRETNIKILENESTNKHSEDSRNSKGNIKTNSDNINQKEQELVNGGKNTIINSLDKSNQIIQEIIDEGKSNNSFKKNRRSSLKPPYEGKQNRDLAVRYGDTQTYMSASKSETNTKNVSQGTDIQKVYIEPDVDHEAEPSLQYKINERVSMRHIRYMNDAQIDPYMAPEQKSPGIDIADDGIRRDGTHSVKNDVGIQCMQDFTTDRSCEAQQMFSYVPNNAVVKEAIANVNPYNPDLCAGLSRVCECPSRPAPGPMSLRTCSGIPVPAASYGERYRTCACGHDPPPLLSSPEPRHSLLQPHHSQPETLYSPPEARHSLPENYHSSLEHLNSPLEPPGTSSEHGNSFTEARQSLAKPRSASLDRTECDASSLTDPTRTHDARTLDCISPGEEKATSTLCESYVTTDGGSLSEGELPAVGGKRLSATQDSMTEPVWGSRPDKMEEALRAISDELTLCRELLQGRGEKVSRRSSQLPSNGQGAPPFALRRASGACRMRDSYTPKCIFTLHVGTVVLADQAAAAARGRWLQASWRLYRQAASSTRALRGRVFNYDCTMHYDLKITEHFLYYLKNEEMPIIISEVNKQDEEFATCALPLRDVLLHPNRRVDMSLALVLCGGGEEAGVLDVWCSLRVDAAALPAINTAIVRPSSLKSQHHSSSILEQILDDDQSADYRYSKDLNLRRNKRFSEDNQSCYNSEILDNVPELRSSVNEVIKNEVPANIRSLHDFKQAVAKKSNDATSIYEMLKNKKWNRRSSQKTQEGGRHKSVTICNQASSSSIDRGNTLNETSETNETNETNGTNGTNGTNESMSYSISTEENIQSLDITILWLALNEGCRAMSDPSVKKLYVAYSFLGRSGADLETPISLPKPKHYMDKCHFLYKKTFQVSECDMLNLGRLACCMPVAGDPDPSRAVVFSIVSEPADDPLGLYSCEDIGYAYLYLGELLFRSAGNSHTAVLEIKDDRRTVCGALAVRIDGLALLRRCKELTGTPRLYRKSIVSKYRSHSSVTACDGRALATEYDYERRNRL